MNETVSRRKFMKQSLPLGLGLMALPQTLLSSCAKPKSAIDIGIQLYSVKDEMHIDPKGTLQALSKMGYQTIESYEGTFGIFWGMEPKDFKNYCIDLGLNPVASHCEILGDFEALAAQCAEVDIKHLICPWLGPSNTIDFYKKSATLFNECGEICKAYGLRFAYHNHDYSFRRVEGQIPQNVLMDETDPALVDFEMDIYWVVTAGEDPLDWLKKYPGRFKHYHIKDRQDKDLSHLEVTTDLGKGIIDFNKILKHELSAGIENFFVEQEHFPYGNPLEAAEANATYLKNLLGT